ncbi:MAG: c-type cytochrome [Burkholderiales bacterium]
MRTAHLIAAAVAGIVFTGAAHAADAAKAQALIKGSDCAACHAADTKLVGPSYKDIAKKYKGHADAVGNLVKKVKAGGSGNWGAIPMTPHPNLKDDDTKTIVEWILSH